MHIFKNQGKSGVINNRFPPCSNNATHTVCDENTYLVPTVFKMN